MIAPALGEIIVTSTLDVAMDGAETVDALGCSTGDDAEVLVVVRPAHATVTPLPNVR